VLERCSPAAAGWWWPSDSEHRDLFYGYSSYGTLSCAARQGEDRAGEAVRAPRARAPRRRRGFFGNVAAACASAVDFVDGVVFEADEW
jgi:hypothetical protein